MTVNWRNTAIIAAAVGVALLTTVVAQPGPAWLWATDACPSSEIACGHLPLGILVIGGVVLGASVVVERVSNREAQS